MDLNSCDPRDDLWTLRLRLHVLTGTILYHKIHRFLTYNSAISWRYGTSYHCVICGALLRNCSLPTQCLPQHGTLDMCGTARIFRLAHNICIKSTSTMLNPGRSAA